MYEEEVEDIDAEFPVELSLAVGSSRELGEPSAEEESSMSFSTVRAKKNLTGSSEEDAEFLVELSLAEGSSGELGESLKEIIVSFSNVRIKKNITIWYS